MCSRCLRQVQDQYGFDETLSIAPTEDDDDLVDSASAINASRSEHITPAPIKVRNYFYIKDFIFQALGMQFTKKSNFVTHHFNHIYLHVNLFNLLVRNTKFMKPNKVL